MSGFDGLDDLDEVELGRVSIYTQVGEWVAYAPISDRATRIYWLLCAHVNVKRLLPNGQPDRRAFPSQKRLAAAIGVKRTETISAAVKELEAIGAVSLRKKRYENKLRERIIYTVHMNPPDNYTGPRSNQEFELPDDDTTAEEEAAEQASDQQRDAKPQVSPGPGNPGGRTPLKTGWNKTKNNKTKKDLSPTARPHSAERGRQRSTKPTGKRTNRRADYPDSNDWINEDDRDEMVCNIVAHVESLYGEIAGLDGLLQSKITAPLDPDTFEELPFTPLTPQHLMNTALKAGRWGTVDFLWIKQQEAAGREPGDQPAPDPWAA